VTSTAPRTVASMDSEPVVAKRKVISVFAILGKLRSLPLG
jgi:hypothetical protein